MYILISNCSETATERRNLRCCCCSIMVTAERICIFIDCTCWNCCWAHKLNWLRLCYYDHWADVYVLQFQRYWDGRIGVYFWDYVNIVTGQIYWDSHGVYEFYNFRECIDIVTGLLWWDSHWVCGFIVVEPILILSLSVVYLSRL